MDAKLLSILSESKLFACARTIRAPDKMRDINFHRHYMIVFLTKSYV